MNETLETVKKELEESKEMNETLNSQMEETLHKEKSQVSTRRIKVIRSSNPSTKNTHNAKKKSTLNLVRSVVS